MGAARLVVVVAIVSAAGCVPDTPALDDEAGASTTSDGDGDGEGDGTVVEGMCGFDTWEPVTPPAVPRAVHAAVRLADGRVLITGGRLPDSDASLASGEVWEPTKDAWTPIADMPVARSGHELVTLADGRVLAIGGGDPLTRTDHYDPSLDTWFEAGSLPLEFDVHDAIAMPDGGVLVAGAALLRSDDLGDSWTAVQAPPQPVYTFHMFAWQADTLVFAAATDGSRTLTPFWFYDWSDDAWTESPPLDLSNERVAWGPLSDTELAIVKNRPGNDPDPTPPAVSLTHELRPPDGELQWEGPYEGPFLSGAYGRAEPVLPGMLWLVSRLYDSETHTWCRLAASEVPTHGLLRTMLPEGRLLLTGTFSPDDRSVQPIALLWSP